MKCCEIAEELSAYACGDVTKEEQTEIEAHLRECAECRRSLEEIRVIQSKIRESFRVPVETPDLTQSIMSMLPAPTPRHAWNWGWAWAAACLVMIVIAGLFAHSWTTHTKPVAVVPEPVMNTPSRPKIDAPKPSMPKPSPKIRVANSPKPDKPRVSSPRRRLIAVMPIEPVSPRPVVKKPSRRVRESNPPSEPANSAPSIEVGPEIASSASDGHARHNQVMVSISIGEFKLSASRNRVLLPIGRNLDAESIERPPLQPLVNSNSAPSSDDM